MQRSLGGRALHAVFGPINKRKQWHELPFPINLLNLLSLRLDLRDFNLHDTTDKYVGDDAPEQEPPVHYRRARHPEGKWTDLRDPEIGSCGPGFARNLDTRRI